MSLAEQFKSGSRRDVLLLTLVNLSIPVFVLLQRNNEDLNDKRSIFVGWISVILLNAAFLFGMYRRRRRTHQEISSRLIFVAGALAILSGIITTISISAFPRHNSYMELAQSGIPLHQIEPEQKRLIVELIRRTAANSAENTRIAQSMKPISPPLYSVNSFANKAAMESTSSQLKQAYDIDVTYTKRRSQILSEFHDKMERVDPSYLQSFEASNQNEDVGEAAIASSEEKWIASALDLYAYAGAHANVISIVDGNKLQIADPDVRRELSGQLEASKALQQDMLANRRKVVDQHHSLQDSLDVSRSN